MDGSIAPAGVTPGATSSGPRPRGRWRRRLLLGCLLLGLLSAGGWYGRYWWTTGRFLESTDDAYTQADSVAVASRISGQVSEVLVTDNQRVSAGQVLARIDDRDYRAALAQAEADLASASADIGSIDAQIALQQATIAQAQADMTSAQAGLAFAQADYRRYTELARSGTGSVQRAEQADSDIRQKAATVSHAQAALAAANQQSVVLQAQRAKSVATEQRSRAAVDQAKLNLSYTIITAPFDGAVGDRAVRVGQVVQPGTRLLDVVPTGRDIYVVANFKETQLAQLWRGQKADLAVDMFGGKKLLGHVDSLAPGSGSQFALLPPENATGNFTKVVQRVPVKIMLDVTDPALLAKLRPGVSVIATVDTRTTPDGMRHTLVDENRQEPTPVANAR